MPDSGLRSKRTPRVAFATTGVAKIDRETGYAPE